MIILFKIPVKKITAVLVTAAVFFLLPFTSSSQSKAIADSLLQKGLQEKQNGRRLESLKQFEKAIKYDDNNKAILNELASAYVDLRKHDKAIETYKKLVELGDGTAVNYKQLLILTFNYKQNNEVLFYADKLKQADPNEKVNYYIGKVEYDSDNYGEAIKHLTAAAKEDTKNAEVPYMIARSYADMQNFKDAVYFFKKAIDLDTSKPYWIYEMGLIYYAMNDNKNALKYIKEAGDKGLKRDNEYMENLAIAYVNVGDAENGIAILNEVLKRRPTDINILNMVAEAYYDHKKYQDAIDTWDKILFIDKQNASALYMIGLSFQKKGEKEKGQLLCDKAIAMDPNLESKRQKKMMMGM